MNKYLLASRLQQKKFYLAARSQAKVVDSFIARSLRLRPILRPVDIYSNAKGLVTFSVDMTNPCTGLETLGIVLEGWCQFCYGSRMNFQII